MGIDVGERHSSSVLFQSVYLNCCTSHFDRGLAEVKDISAAGANDLLARYGI